MVSLFRFVQRIPSLFTTAISSSLWPNLPCPRVPSHQFARSQFFPLPESAYAESCSSPCVKLPCRRAPFHHFARSPFLTLSQISCLSLPLSEVNSSLCREFRVHRFR